MAAESVKRFDLNLPLWNWILYLIYHDPGLATLAIIGHFLSFHVFDKAKHHLNDVLEIFLWVFLCNNQGTCNLKNGLCGFIPKNTDCWKALSFWFWIWQMNSCFPHYIFKSSWSALKYNQFAGWNYKPYQKSSWYS